MSSECKAQIISDEVRSSQDYRLNFKLAEACKTDTAELCANKCEASQACGGQVLRCLTDKSDDIKSKACRDEVFYFKKMEVTDFRNDVILAEACRSDVDAYCKNVKPGQHLISYHIILYYIMLRLAMLEFVCTGHPWWMFVILYIVLGDRACALAWSHRFLHMSADCMVMHLKAWLWLCL